MTELLFHRDAYMTEFDAHVIECLPQKDGRWGIELDKTAFYYTSGGQPFDTGELGGQAVSGVEKEGGRVLHFVSAPIAPGSAVHGRIDWPRRFDHMCQHAGDHLMAGEIYRLWGGTTIGLHCGADVSSIDVDMHGVELGRAELDVLETAVMERILADAPIRCWFPSQEELKALPLRKPPTVTENIRIVGMGDFEFVACGGTHPSTTGQVGLIKITEARMNRGNLRIFFLAGSRAFRFFQSTVNAMDAAARLMSASYGDLAGRIEKMQADAAALRHSLNERLTSELLALAPAMINEAVSTPSCAAVFACAPQPVPEQAVRALAAAITEARPDAAAFITAPTEAGGYSVVFARGASCAARMGAIMRQTLPALGGKGGGRDDFAMGGLPNSADPKEMKEKLLTIL